MARRQAAQAEVAPRKREEQGQRSRDLGWGLVPVPWGPALQFHQMPPWPLHILLRMSVTRVGSRYLQQGGGLGATALGLRHCPLTGRGTRVAVLGAHPFTAGHSEVRW